MRREGGGKEKKWGTEGIIEIECWRRVEGRGGGRERKGEVDVRETDKESDRGGGGVGERKRNR